MARNNRELSQLGAFISITDNTQEIGSGALNANEVNRHVMAIGATDHTGLTVPPAIGIGTTNPGKDKVTVLADVNIARQIGGGGGNLIVDQGVTAATDSEFKGLVNFNAGLTPALGGDDPTSNTVAFRVSHGQAEFGNKVEISPEVAFRNFGEKQTAPNLNGYPVGLGTTVCNVSLVDCNVAIKTSTFYTPRLGETVVSETSGTSNKILTQIPVEISRYYHILNQPQDRNNPSLDVFGYSKFGGPIRIYNGGIDLQATLSTSFYDPTVGVQTSPNYGTLEIDQQAGHIAVKGSLAHAGGEALFERVAISTYTLDGSPPEGYIRIPKGIGGNDFALESHSGTDIQNGFETDSLYVGSKLGISTILGALVVESSSLTNSDWDVGIGQSDGPTLQVLGSAQFDGGMRVGKAENVTVSNPDKTVAIHAGAGITATNLHLYGDGSATGFAKLEAPLVSIGSSNPDTESVNAVSFIAPIDGSISPKDNGALRPTTAGSLGNAGKYWLESWVDEGNVNKLSISTSIVNSGGLYQTGIATIGVDGKLVYSANNPAEFFTPMNVAGVSSFQTMKVTALTVAEDIAGTATTSLRAQAVDVGLASTNIPYRLVLSDKDGGVPPEVSNLFVDGDIIEDSITYNPVSDILNVPGDLNLRGTDTGGNLGVIQILAPESRSLLRFFQTNVASAELLTIGSRSITIGSTLGITTISSYRNAIRGDLLLGAIGLSTVSISDVNGLENITITGNTLTEFAGNMAMEGDTFDVRNDVFNFCNSNSTIISAFALGDQISMGATVGFTSIRNPVLRTAGSVRIDGDLISDSSGSDHISLVPASGGTDAITRLAGDLQVDGRDIRVAGGITNITMNTDINTTFAGDITVGGNEIRNGDGSLNITLLGDGLTSIGGTLRIEGDEIQAGTGVTNITLTQNFTQIEKDLRVNGNNIRSSDNNINITMDGTTRTSVSGNLAVGNNIIEASDQQAAIILTPSSGSVAISSNLTVNNDFEVLGSETDIKSENVRIKDTLVSIGLTEGTGTGSLVVPTVDENKDVGLILNYYDAGSKQAALFWDDSLGSVGIASDVSETSSVLTVNQYAKIIAKSIAISDCAGTSDIIQCEGTTRTLANIVIDGGEY